MLFQFISENRSELIRRTRSKVLARSSPRATPEEIETGVPLFLTQFTDLLSATRESSEGTTDTPQTPAIAQSAARHGSELLRHGFTIAQVVHDYGDICQAVTELASERKEKFTTSEFHLLNLCLDNAIADAVTEYSRQREQDIAGEEVKRLGSLAHELRNLISTGTLAFEILSGGMVSIGGSTGGVLKRALAGLRDLVDRSLAEVRLASEHQHRTRVVLSQFIEEIEMSASLGAKAKNITLSVAHVQLGLAVDADRELLGSAVSKLLQNAYKFTGVGGRVWLRAHAKTDRIFIEVEDECGGLAPGQAEDLFRLFERRGNTDKPGLGLAFSRESVDAHGGEIRVANTPGKGCIFTIELPVAA